MRRHPSGRPARRQIVKSALSIYRVPPSEPLTPGLRTERGSVNAIGFHVEALNYDEEDDEGRG